MSFDLEIDKLDPCPCIPKEEKKKDPKSKETIGFSVKEVKEKKGKK